MRKTTYLSFAIVFLTSCSKLCDFIPHPPTPALPQFSKVYGEKGNFYAYAVAACVDGGYVVAGVINSPNGNISGYHGGFTDAMVMKLDKEGNMVWRRILGGSGDDDFAAAIVANPDGSCIMAGKTDSNDGDVTGYHGRSDAWVVKLDKWGNIVWQRALGGSNPDEAKAIITSLDGGYVIAGVTNSNDGDVSGQHGNADAWVVKLDNKGTIQWQSPLGGTLSDYANAIASCFDSGYIIAGIKETGKVGGIFEHNDAWIVKLDKQGKKQWEKSIGGTGYDIATVIAASPDGGYITAGLTTSQDGDFSGYYGLDPWVMKLDESGNKQWQKAPADAGRDGGRINAITKSLDGGYVMAGIGGSSVSGYQQPPDAWVFKLDKKGNKLWQKALGGSRYDHGWSIISRSDGSYVLAGDTNSNDGDVHNNPAGYIAAWVITVKDK